LPIVSISAIQCSCAQSKVCIAMLYWVYCGKAWLACANPRLELTEQLWDWIGVWMGAKLCIHIQTS